MRRRVSPARQFVPLLFVALSVDTLVRPFVSPAGAGAQGAVWASLMLTAALCVLVTVFYRFVPDSALILLRRGRLGQARAVLCLFAAAASFAGGASLVTTERFYRYVSDEPTLSLITAALVLASAAYAVSRGALTVTRAAGIVCVLLLISGLLLATSSLQSARLENLTYAQDPLADVGKWLSAVRVLPAEILCFLLLKEPEGKHDVACLRRAFLFSALFFIGIAVLEELVLGQRAGLQLQPAHTLARLGGLSVFKRFDALHAGLWLLALLTRQTLFLYGVRTAVCGIFPERMRRFCVPASLLATLAAAFAASALPQAACAALISIGTAAALSAAVLFSVCMGVER